MAKDLCIMCGKETAYDFETHIDSRIGYIEGAGQLCHDCYTNVPTTDITSSLDIVICVSEDTIINTPNDFELGGKVRELYWEYKK
jgi:hypothetical protein